MSSSRNLFANSSVFPNQGYEITFNGGTPLRAHFALRKGQDRWVRLSLDYPVTPKITKQGCDLADTACCCGVEKPTALRSWPLRQVPATTTPEPKRLYLKLVSANTDFEELIVEPL